MNDQERRVERLEEKVGAGGGCEVCSFLAGVEILLADFAGVSWEVRPDDSWPEGGEQGNRLLRVCQRCGRNYEAVLLQYPKGF